MNQAVHPHHPHHPHTIEALTARARNVAALLKESHARGLPPSTQARLELEPFFEELSERLYRFTLKRCGAPDEAEEVTQEALLVILRRLPIIEEEVAVVPWCFGVARTLCLKRMSGAQKRARREGSLEELIERGSDELLAAHTAREAEEEVGRELSWEETQRALQLLSPLYREVLLLRDVEGLSAEEVSQVVGASVGAVKSRLHRARAELREALTSSTPLPPLPEEPCPDVRQLFSESLEGDLSPTLCRDMEAHVRVCVSCARECDALKQTLHLCSTSPQQLPPHVAEQLKERLYHFVKEN
jgi:RNA polymerase sigma-70 factor, ECF subfamily